MDDIEPAREKAKEKKSSGSRSCTSADDLKALRQLGSENILGSNVMKAEEANSNHMLDFFQNSLLGKRQSHLCSKTSDDGFTRQQIKLPNRIIAKMNASSQAKAEIMSE